MPKYLLLLSITILVTGCDNTELKEKVTQKDSEIMSLQQQVEGLNKKISELENTEQNLFNSCQDKYNKAIIHTETDQSLVNSTDAKETCAQLAVKYPTGQYQEQINDMLSELEQLIIFYSGIHDVFENIHKNKFDEASQAIDSIKQFLKKEDLKKILALIAKSRDKPILFESMRDFHKAASTGMPVGKKYIIDAALVPEGNRLCAGLKYEKYCSDSETSVDVINSFYGDQAKSFYDMRGEYGCFVVTMNYDGKIEIVDYSTGKCN